MTCVCRGMKRRRDSRTQGRAKGAGRVGGAVQTPPGKAGNTKPPAEVRGMRRNMEIRKRADVRPIAVRGLAGEREEKDGVSPDFRSGVGELCGCEILRAAFG